MKRSPSLGICCRVLELPGQLIGELTLASGRPESSRCRISGVCGWLRWIPIGQPNSAVYSHKASSFKQGVTRLPGFLPAKPSARRRASRCIGVASKTSGAPFDTPKRPSACAAAIMATSFFGSCLLQAGVARMQRNHLKLAHL